ncbi:MAG: PEP-CTERM sorting domain-containing protein [Armatimonadota bacterium]|nr:PEP-CTERM sorting domain-containing protein [Armatimonadota bacterium]
MKSTKLVLSLAVASLAPFASAQIYVNGTPDLAGGNEMTQWLQAENFTLGANNTVGAVRFWSIDAPGVVIDGNIDWWIFNDAAGAPGSIVASGTQNTFSRVATGNVWGGGILDEHVWDFNITGTAVTGGTMYWLGLHVNSDYIRDDIYWETGAGGAAPTGMESDGGTMNNWFNNGNEHAFELYAVPEPSTLIVLGGLAALALARRRR